MKGWRPLRPTFSGFGFVLPVLFLLFFADACGSRPAAEVKTGAGTSTAGFHSVVIEDHTLTLPDGFTISRWVSGRGGLRMMAVTGDGYLLVTEMDKGNVLAFRLADRQPEAVTVVSGLENPSGIAVQAGFVYVAETSKITRYQYFGNGKIGAGEVIVPDLPADGEHITRTIGVGPDNRLYVTVGSSCNVCKEDDPRRAAMSRYNLDGSGGRVIATGLRNTVGFTWQPGSGQIWGVDNGRDNLGDNLAPDEVNVIQPGRNYGWPYCFGDRVADPAFSGKEGFCRASEPPVLELQAHSAPLGLRFLADPSWPLAWQGNLFIAFHGSWNKTVPTGYKVVRVDDAHRVSDFITGWLDESTGQAWGRPVDIIFATGKMYISDDSSGSIYEVRKIGA